jgi:hypothetical protein
MQRPSAQGVNLAHAIINRMIGYVPDLYKPALKGRYN